MVKLNGGGAAKNMIGISNYYSTINIMNPAWGCIIWWSLQTNRNLCFCSWHLTHWPGHRVKITISLHFGKICYISDLILKLMGIFSHLIPAQARLDASSKNSLISCGLWCLNILSTHLLIIERTVTSLQLITLFTFLKKVYLGKR